MTGGWMENLVRIAAPRSWRGAVGRGAVLTALVLLADVTAKRLAGQPTLPWPYEVGLTIAIALPFVALWMVVLHHQWRLKQALAQLATTDALTGLPNRRDFLARARAALDSDGSGVLMLLDADHFKRINDRWGHGTGDAALVAIADHLRAALRPSDIVGRLGGEEFAAFLPHASLDAARALERRLCGPVTVAGAPPEVSVTLSVGAVAALDGVTLDRLMAEADRALYDAKASGRARMRVAVPDMDRAA